MFFVLFTTLYFSIETTLLQWEIPQASERGFNRNGKMKPYADRKKTRFSDGNAGGKQRVRFKRNSGGAQMKF